eukprot:30897-Pelagococcus_subviridis.AAC.30
MEVLPSGGVHFTRNGRACLSHVSRVDAYGSIDAAIPVGRDDPFPYPGTAPAADRPWTVNSKSPPLSDLPDTVPHPIPQPSLPPSPPPLSLAPYTRARAAA